MKEDFNASEEQSANAILTDLAGGLYSQGIEKLRTLKEETHAAIPERLRISRGITWVLQRVSLLLARECGNLEETRATALVLDENLSGDDLLRGVPIFLMAEYGKAHPQEVFDFFEKSALSENWILREFAQAGFRKLIAPWKEMVFPWLKAWAQNPHPYLRRFVGETLRPVTENRWLKTSPEYSLEILRLMFREPNPYPRTSVGNNLSDLSRSNPDLIYALVKGLAESGDKNSYWIAYRACRNLVKIDPPRVMELLGVSEYHYKDRNFFKTES